RADTIMQAKLNSWLAGMLSGGGPLRFDISSPWIWGAAFLNRNFAALKSFREQGSALPVHAVEQLIAGGMQHDVLEAAANIICPTLLMTGDEDLLTPLHYSHELQRRIAGSRLVMLEQAGHCMFLEQPVRFAQIAADFFHETLLKG
ncbi:MAG: 3-oxoadipate enol-lactone hydrolase, partial [Firmicutes bacterium]|nr:3-oxoadipate enol-lactone hydrolase [Bacillota bacterium]